VQQPPSSAVNPLGGTVVADAGAFGGAFPPSPPAGQGGGYDMGAPPPGFGAPQPPADVGYGATAPMMSASAPMAPMPPAPMAPMDDMPIPGTVGGSNPIVTVLLIVLTCGIYGIYLLVKGKKQGAS
jgi:hypothetical protein